MYLGHFDMVTLVMKFLTSIRGNFDLQLYLSIHSKRYTTFVKCLVHLWALVKMT